MATLDRPRRGGFLPEKLRGGFPPGKRATAFLGAALSLLPGPLIPGAPASGHPAAKPLQYSFEDPAELADWTCQPGITTELSQRWASAGKTALQINVPPGTPWFGVQREVKLDEFRKH